MDNVSVIIPNYNYGRFLREAVDSALGQTVAPHEVIVVDDGSTDDSGEILASYGERIIVIRQQNQGVGAARNKGAEIATGEFLAFLDADDYWAPTKLEKQLAVFESDPEIGLVHCGFQNVDADSKLLDANLSGSEGWVADKLLRFEPSITAPGGTTMIRREGFWSVGGYDANPNLHPSEDWDLSYRIARKWKYGFVSEPLLFYRQHGKGGHTNIARMERAMLIGFGKAFADDRELHPIKNECYAKLYLVLAGSYFQAGQYGGFLRNAAKSIWRRPANLRYFLEFPIRRLRR
ncbi:MAG TPA: glycosyltransferase family A protein [Pyrinomonadaceae bacterium]|nr:glycosyltransferase family A protein [Pyrinomonadaceae bacterium]